MSPRVALFVTCLVDLIRPSIGLSAVHLLQTAGCRVSVPKMQTCCGQPSFNIGDNKTSMALALQIIETFNTYDYIVVPSGSCASMLRKNILTILSDPAAVRISDVKQFSSKVYELCSFLVEICNLQKLPGTYTGRITYHDSCTGLRDLGIHSAPRKLLSMVEGAELIEMERPENCCGFGGFFSETYSDISNAILTEKIKDALVTKAHLLVGGDLGCLLNIAGKLAQIGQPLQCRHVAEVLAGHFADPPLTSTSF